MPVSAFQSTHPRGVRRTLRTDLNRDFLFQSTHPRGVRLEPTRACRTFHLCFNPRTREGCDVTAYIMIPILKGFNPRTREGCDQLPGGL